jgi:ABC-type lipoprotein export system ATPase subunit
LNDSFRKTIVMVTHDPRASVRAHTEHHLDKGVLSRVVARHERQRKEQPLASNV